jgi:hypothetical protein
LCFIYFFYYGYFDLFQWIIGTFLWFYDIFYIQWFVNWPVFGSVWIWNKLQLQLQLQQWVSEQKPMTRKGLSYQHHEIWHGKRSLKHVPLLKSSCFHKMQNSIVATQNLHVAFHVTVITNEPWRQIININTNFFLKDLSCVKN